LFAFARQGIHIHRISCGKHQQISAGDSSCETRAISEICGAVERQLSEAISPQVIANSDQRGIHAKGSMGYGNVVLCFRSAAHCFGTIAHCLETIASILNIRWQIQKK
jgi:hypothetical protein